MPLTSDRMLAVIEAAERILSGDEKVEHLALFRPPELDAAAARMSAADATVDDCRAAGAEILALYDGLVDRIRATLRPNLSDVSTIRTEAAHFRALSRHNSAARDSMRRTRARRRADGEGEAEAGGGRIVSRSEFQRILDEERLNKRTADAHGPQSPEDARTQYEQERDKRLAEEEARAAQPNRTLI